MAGPRNQDTRVGSFIRQHVLPPGMSVTDAAQRLGVGRPALSNLLNGKASLSPRMALRLEKAFGSDRQKLLDLQTSSDRDRHGDEDRAVGVRTYVPSFLAITARQIRDWAENNIKARQHLPVLLRRLVHSTGRNLRHVDFPGNDESERPGWDGWVETDEATAWIPEGESGWEFGTNHEPRKKADHDYAARLASVASVEERARSAFVFVTPRSWRGKNDWARNKKASGDWKDVRAFDASVLEQWLEESVAAQIWFAEKLNLPVDGVRTLDECWDRWTDASEPRMTGELFESSVSAHRTTFKKWLDGPSARPLVVAADSKDEALAFLARLFRDEEVPARSRDIAAVFESAQTLRTLAPSSSPFIPIVYSEETERELGAIYRQHHCIVVRPRNAVDREPDIALDLLDYETFRKSLTAMGFERDDIERLGRESGRSPTILRRRLSKIDAIRTPQWANDPEVARCLVPMTLIGAWHAASCADREVLSTLAGRPYGKSEENLTRLLQHYDCPVWSVGQYRGIASKIDALFATSMSVTAKDLADFMVLAEYVLSESDPSLELLEDQRWAAATYGKVRDHSAALRTGVCETLVMLSVHGNDLFRNRLGIDVDNFVSQLIGRLLTPLTIEKLLSHDHDLPRYAEAAPDEVLTLLEEDLKQEEPILYGLLKPADPSVFGGCPRTGLLWALECLAWNPRHLPRVCLLLAQLSRTKIDDNWVNKPFRSLGAIFRSWMPQTAASLDERVQTLEMLCSKFDDVGWQLCIEQLVIGPKFGDFSYRPRWRSDASGAGEPVTKGEMCGFIRKALDLTLAWPRHDGKTLGDLVERLDGISEEDQSSVWDLVDAWLREKSVEDKEVADLRERIRRFALTMRGRHRGLNAATRDKAREVYERLAPRDPTARHAWLFTNQWVQESSDGIEDDYLDMSKREKRIHKLRTEAITEIWQEHGFEGAAALLARSNAPEVVGRYTALCVKGQNEATEILRTCLSGAIGPDHKLDGFMMGFMAYINLNAGPKVHADILLAIAEKAGAEQVARIFRCAPFGNQTWRLLDKLSQEVRDRYWREVLASGWVGFTEEEWAKLVDRLLEAKRPLAAFRSSAMHWEKMETSRLKRLLMAVVNAAADAEDGIQNDSCEISRALSALEGRIGVTSDEMVRLEFAFIEALAHSSHGIPNLEREIAKSPDIFVQALALVYPRNDDGRDPPEWNIGDSERRSAAAMAAYTLLEGIRRIPGTDTDGKIRTESLQKWVAETRRMCVEYGRSDIGDEQIGQLLSRASAEENGLRPCRPVCEVMEAVASQDIANGLFLGTRNARSVSVRKVGEGGGQERNLAGQYRRWAEQRAFDYPFVSTVLNRIANSYDEEAQWWDSDVKVKKRLHL